MTWSVVHFMLDDTVEVVPEHWCVKKGYCAWPNTKKKSDLKNAVINRIKPKKKTFNLFKARTLAYNIDDFQVAQKKCIVAKSKSDLSSSEETAKTRKQRKQKVMINSDSEDGEFSDDESDDSMPSLSSIDDEVKKSNEKKLTISKDPGWSPLKRSVVESSYAHITSTPVNQTTDQLISDIKSLNSKSKYYHNDNGNSVPLKDDVIAQTNHSINTPFTTKTTVSPPQNTVDNYNSCLNSNIIAKEDSPHLSFAKRSLFSDLDKSQNLGIIDSPIKISTRTLSDNNCSMVYNLMNSPSTSNEQTVQKVDNCVIIKTTESKSSNSKQQKSLHKDNQYAKLLNYMITMKYEMRSIHEKLDILIQTGEENSMTKMTRESGVFDTSIIDSRLPIENEGKLETFENDISTDKSFRNQLVLRLSSVGGKSIKCMVKRIMTLLFTPEILCKFSYNGRGNKKRPFEKLLVKNVIFESVKTIKKFALSDNASNEIEQVIKYVLIQTPFKIKNKTSG